MLLGMACWTVPAGICIWLCLSLGWVDIVVRTTATETARIAVLLVVLVFLYEALPEELVFRGYIRGSLRILLRPWQAVGAQAALFALFGFVLGVAPTVDRLIVFRSGTGRLPNRDRRHRRRCRLPPGVPDHGPALPGRGRGLRRDREHRPSGVRAGRCAVHTGLDGDDPYVPRSHRLEYSRAVRRAGRAAHPP